MNELHLPSTGLLDPEQLAKHLGISVDGLKKMVAKRRIPVVKLGYRTLRFSLAKVEAALAKLTVEAI